MVDHGEVNGHNSSLESTSLHSLYISDSSDYRTSESGICSSCSPLGTHVTDTPTSKFQRYLMESFELSDIWISEFGDNKESAQQGWKKFLHTVFDKYDKFLQNMKEMECAIQEKIDADRLLDTVFLTERSKEIEAAYDRMEDEDKEYIDVVKTLSNVSHYFPKGIHREKIEEMVRRVRCRHFDLLHLLHRKKLIFRRILQHFEKYRSAGSEIKASLDSMESRCEAFISNFNDSEETMPNECAINGLIADLKKNKGIIDTFVSAGSGIIDIDHHMEIDELRQDMEDVVQRWDMLNLEIEGVLGHIKIEKNIASLAKKSDGEKIDFKIQEEFHMCTCSTPFQITKVGEGKYTFGVSKTVRLLRINGSTIVVRVGGGWQYLFDFLLKVDPCRAQQLAGGASLQAIQSSGVTFTSLDKKNSDFTMSVKRMNRSSWIPTRYLARKNGISDSVSLENQSNKCMQPLNSAEALDTPSQPLMTSSSKKRLSNSTPRTGSRKRVERRLHDSSDNIHSKKTDTPQRVSLIDRQKLYADKRVRSAENLLD